MGSRLAVVEREHLKPKLVHVGGENAGYLRPGNDGSGVVEIAVRGERTQQAGGPQKPTPRGGEPTLIKTLHGESRNACCQSHSEAGRGEEKVEGLDSRQRTLGCPPRNDRSGRIYRGKKREGSPEKAQDA